AADLRLTCFMLRGWFRPMDNYRLGMRGPGSIAGYMGRGALLLAWLIWFDAPARGASLGVEPVTLMLDARSPIAALTLTNQGEESILVQGQLFLWTMAGGSDV